MLKIYAYILYIFFTKPYSSGKIQNGMDKRMGKVNYRNSFSIWNVDMYNEIEAFIDIVMH